MKAPGTLALLAAIVSIAVKEILYQYPVLVGKSLNSKVVVANAWHHRNDAFSSIGTMIGICGAIFLGEQWRVLDPLAALVVSIFIVKVSIQLAVPCINELLEKSLPLEEEKIRSIILSFPEITSPHHLRTKHIGNNIAIEAHIRMDGKMTLNNAHKITQNIEKKLKTSLVKIHI